MKDLQGRCAIVTGASAGLGVHIARALASEGMNLVLAARSAQALEEVAAEIRRLGVKAIAAPTDVSDDRQLENLVQKALIEFNGIDVLINNAGIANFRPFPEIESEEIRRTINVNLTASLLLTRLVLPHMMAARQGHIVNMASTAGKFGPAFGAAYGATKAALIAFTQSLRGEFRGTGISASAVCPGFASDGGIYEEVRQRVGQGTPWYVGSTNAESVARAVVKAIRRDQPEVIVNFPALRPVFVLCQALPRLGEWIVRATTFRFLKRAARR